MFATRTRLAAAWAIDLYLGHALWFCITTQAALPEMQGGVFWLLPVVTARLLLTQIASTPGRHALAIDIHDRLDSRVARGEDVFSRLLGTAFLFFGVQLLIQAATRAPTAVPFGPGDDAALLVLGPYVLAAMFISSAIELLRLGRLGWCGAMAGCIATMFWVLLDGAAVDAWLTGALAYNRAQAGLALRGEEVQAFLAVAKPAMLLAASFGMALLTTMHGQFFQTAREPTPTEEFLREPDRA